MVTRSAAALGGWEASLGWGAPGALVGAAVVLVAAAPDGPVLCPWRLTTGVSCPGCGATRAAAALLRGELAASWDSHPLVLVLAAQAAALAALVLVPGGARPLRSLLHAGGLPLAVANVALLVAVWGFRLSTGALPGPVT